MDLQDWLPLCLAFQDAGASILQLDFFYMGTFLEQPDFAKRLSSLLSSLSNSLSCQIMPKVNIDLPANFIFPLMAKAGIKGVSLLDSVRVPVTDAADGSVLPYSSTSCFGAWQLPLSLHYAYVAKQEGLEVCGGGGITNQTSVSQMFLCGASLIQVASTVLIHGYQHLHELTLTPPKNIPTTPASCAVNYIIQEDKCTRCHICTNSTMWCNAISLNKNGTPFINKELCENCGWCAARCPNNAILDSTK